MYKIAKVTIVKITHALQYSSFCFENCVSNNPNVIQ